jgi:hypothetical protein
MSLHSTQLAHTLTEQIHTLRPLRLSFRQLAEYHQHLLQDCHSLNRIGVRLLSYSNRIKYSNNNSWLIFNNFITLLIGNYNKIGIFLDRRNMHEPRQKWKMDIKSHRQRHSKADCSFKDRPRVIYREEGRN